MLFFCVFFFLQTKRTTTKNNLHLFLIFPHLFRAIDKHPSAFVPVGSGSAIKHNRPRELKSQPGLKNKLGVQNIHFIYKHLSPVYLHTPPAHILNY